MLPRSQFLMETIPYFIENQRLRQEGLEQGVKPSSLPKPLGFLQVLQSFYNSDCFQYRLFTENLIPNEQKLFSSRCSIRKKTAPIL